MRSPRLPALVIGTLCLVAPLSAQEHENPYLRPVSDNAGVRRGPYYASAGVGIGGEAIAGPSGYRERIINVGLTLTFDGHN